MNLSLLKPAKDKIGLRVDPVDRSLRDEIGPFTRVVCDPQVDWPEPTPKQYEFICSKALYPAMWGAKGASKTWALVMRCIALLVDSPYHGNMAGNRGFLARQEWQSFKATTMRELFRLLPRQWIRRYVKQDRVVELENGSELILGHFDDLAPIVGINLGFAAFDQLEQMDLDTWEEFQNARVRMTAFLDNRPMDYRSCFGVGNPPGPSHWCYKWVKIDRDKSDDNYHFIPVSAQDNEQNLPPGYIETARKNLAKNPKKFRIDFLGSWEGLSGACWPEWDREAHLLKQHKLPLMHWRKCIALDYGRSKGHAATFLAINEDVFPPKVLVYDEAYLEGALVEDHCALIAQKMEQHCVGMQVKMEQYLHSIVWVHDPAMSRLADTAGKSGAAVTIVGLYQEALAMRGIYAGLVPANNEIDGGLDRVSFLFREKRLEMSPICTNHIEQIESYINDEKTGKPKAGQKDHCCDTLRYGVSAIYVYIQAAVEPVKETVVQRILRRERENQMQYGEAV